MDDDERYTEIFAFVVSVSAVVWAVLFLVKISYTKWLQIGGKSNTKQVWRQRPKNNNLLEYANVCRKNGLFNDVTISVGGKNFPANRMILSCYSKFFERMFESEMKEKYQGLVEIKDIEATTMESLIEFIYTGSITINTDNVCDLLAASDFLQLHDFKYFCFEFLETFISAESCFTIHTLADRYRNDELMEKVKQFIDDNFTDISTKNDFKHLTENEVKNCISNLDRNKVRNKTIFRSIVDWTKFDLANRRGCFHDFLSLVNLDKLPLAFLEDVSTNEKLVVESQSCLKLLLETFVKRNKETRIGGYSSGSRILSLGGLYTQTNVTEIFTFFESNPNTFPNLPVEMVALCSLSVESCIYIMGGQSKLNTCETTSDDVYRMNSKDEVMQWEQVAPMNEKRCQIGACVLNGLIFVVGGINELGCSLSSAEYFTPTFNKWKNLPPMKQNRYGHALVTCKGCIYAIGGNVNGTELDTVERFQPSSDKWDDVRPMRTPRFWLVAVAINDVIYAIGGQFGKESDTRLKSVERYDVTTRTWTYVKEMTVERVTCSACVLQGKIYVSGGLDTGGAAVKTIECYDPSTDEWTVVGHLEDKLVLHSTIVI